MKWNFTNTIIVIIYLALISFTPLNEICEFFTFVLALKIFLWFVTIIGILWGVAIFLFGYYFESPEEEQQNVFRKTIVAGAKKVRQKKEHFILAKIGLGLIGLGILIIALSTDNPKKVLFLLPGIALVVIGAWLVYQGIFSRKKKIATE